MQSMRRSQAVWAVAIFILLLAAAPLRAENGQPRYLFQVSSIAALLSGVYDGGISVGELKSHGDFGLGTFKDLDGEMVMLDGVCYQALVTGDVRVAQDGAATPFAAVAFFRTAATADIGPVESMDDLAHQLDGMLPDPNRFYAVRLSGTFGMVKARSVPRQSRPYPPLAEAAKGQQVFTARSVAGDLVALYCPPAAAGLNVSGWHIHFLDAARKRGGHLLDVAATSLRMEASPLDGLQVLLPRSTDHDQARLCQDREEELKRVER